MNSITLTDIWSSPEEEITQLTAKYKLVDKNLEYKRAFLAYLYAKSKILNANNAKTLRELFQENPDFDSVVARLSVIMTKDFKFQTVVKSVEPKFNLIFQNLGEVDNGQVKLDDVAKLYLFILRQHLIKMLEDANIKEVDAKFNFFGIIFDMVLKIARRNFLKNGRDFSIENNLGSPLSIAYAVTNTLIRSIMVLYSPDYIIKYIDIYHFINNPRQKEYSFLKDYTFPLNLVKSDITTFNFKEPFMIFIENRKIFISLLPKNVDDKSADLLYLYLYNKYRTYDSEMLKTMMVNNFKDFTNLWLANENLHDVKDIATMLANDTFDFKFRHYYTLQLKESALLGDDINSLINGYLE